MNRQGDKKNGGFSLIEALIVVAMMAIVFAVVAPFSLNFYRGQLLGEARANLADIMGRARHNALLQKNDSNFGLYVDNAAHNYTLYQGASYAVREGDDEIYDFLPEIAISLPDEASEINFTKLTGLPSATGTVALTLGSSVENLLIGDTGSLSEAD